MRKLLFLALIACVAGAVWYALEVEPGSAPTCAPSARLSAAEVEKSFSEESALMAAGHDAEAAILLERKAKTGEAQRGVALFLLGEVAFEAGAEAKALERYNEALKADPTLADKGAPFGAEKKMLARAQSLKKGKWAGKDKSSPELAKLSALERKLSGGCK